MSCTPKRLAPPGWVPTRAGRRAQLFPDCSLMSVTASAQLAPAPHGKATARGAPRGVFPLALRREALSDPPAVRVGVGPVHAGDGQVGFVRIVRARRARARGDRARAGRDAGAIGVDGDLGAVDPERRDGHRANRALVDRRSCERGPHDEVPAREPQHAVAQRNLQPKRGRVRGRRLLVRVLARGIRARLVGFAFVAPGRRPGGRAIRHARRRRDVASPRRGAIRRRKRAHRNRDHGSAFRMDDRPGAAPECDARQSRDEDD